MHHHALDHHALDGLALVRFSAQAGDLLLAAAGQAAPLLLDPADAAPVRRVAGDLADDIHRVSAARPALLSLAAGAALPSAPVLVVVGTLGGSAWVADLARRGLIDAAALQGRWEGLLIQAVDRPWPGVAQALVLAGSDARGAIYAQTTLGEQIGVSPWLWWADVPPHHHAVLAVPATTRHADAPVVRWRGVFLNDEAPALSGWVQQFHGGYTHTFYARVFELLLRLRANLLWPAMWAAAFYDDDPANGPTADAYGIVMGTSHHEPMQRAQQEWHRLGPPAVRGPWDYRRNAPALRRFWAGGAQRAARHETLVTVGMRGDGDEPMEAGTDVALLARIIGDQRALLAQASGRPADAQPQVLALYKEVQAYLEQGLDVPDDVLLLFSDDNWGHLRRLPTPAQRQRRGGAGIYYHFDYVGGPRSYKWLNVTPLPKVWSQLHLAWRHGADRLWIANVGDLKPMEVPMEFFLRCAWNPEAWPAQRLDDYLPAWAAREFGPAQAAEAAALVAGYVRGNGRCKPELLAPDTYSLLHGHEAETVLAEWQALASRAQRWWAALPAERQDAGYQLVLHPVLACANLQALLDAVGRNRLYAAQGRAGALAQATRARALFDHDAALTRRYHTLGGGKWNHLMAQVHIGYTSWNQPPANRLPDLASIDPPGVAALGVAVEGQAGAGRAGAVLDLPLLDAWAPDELQWRWVDVFNRGRAPLRWRIDVMAPVDAATAATAAAAASPPATGWLVVQGDDGTAVATGVDDRRLRLGVRWAQLPPGVHRARLRISADDGAQVDVQVSAVQPGPRPATPGHLEALGVVALEAAHTTARHAPPGTQWLDVPGGGHTGSALTVLPVTGPVPGAFAASGSGAPDGPALVYTLHLRSAGPVTLHAVLSPTLTIRGSHLRYAVAVDGEPAQVVDVHQGLGEPEQSALWSRWVKEGVMVHTTPHTIDQPGSHTLRFWPLDGGLVLQRLVLDAGGLWPSRLGPPESVRG